MDSTVLKSPFPYFGGKSTVADLVWSRLGDPDNYVEPFAGSLAVLLRRPNIGKVETVNDRNHYIVNFWRSVQSDVEGVVRYADGPVTEADLHARHSWLVNSNQAVEFRDRIVSHPEYFDSMFAGWWVWGQCCWIGGGWCDGKGITTDGVSERRRPKCNADSLGNGIHTASKSNKHAGSCDERRQWLSEWIQRLSDRLRLVRVCYGEWNRICDSKTTMDRLGITGAFLDPPYAKNIERVQSFIRGESPTKAKSINRASELYSGDRDQDIDRLVADVYEWCQRWGSNDKIRIVLCGYDGEHDNLVTDHGWSVEAWKAQGGYGNRNSENQNKYRERIWFSPACEFDQGLLF